MIKDQPGARDTDHKDPAFLTPVLVQQDFGFRNGCLITDDWNRCGIIGFSVKIYYQARNLARIAGAWSISDNLRVTAAAPISHAM